MKVECTILLKEGAIPHAMVTSSYRHPIKNETKGRARQFGKRKGYTSSRGANPMVSPDSGCSETGRFPKTVL